MLNAHDKFKDSGCSQASQGGNTPLCLAAKAGQSKTVRLLAEDARVHVNRKNLNGKSPIALAAKRGHIDVVKILLEHEKIELNAISPGSLNSSTDSTKIVGHFDCEQGCTMLFHAVLRGRTKLVQALIKSHKINVNAGTLSGQTPLMAAASCATLECAKLLLGVEAIDTNAKDTAGWTALAYAAEVGCAEIADRLITQGNVDINVKTNDGQTPLFLAVPRPRWIPYLPHGCMPDRPRTTRLLIEEGGADVDQYADTPTLPIHGMTPLMVAVSDNSSTYPTLLDHGADPAKRHGLRKNETAVTFVMRPDYFNSQTVERLYSKMPDSVLNNETAITLVMRPDHLNSQAVERFYSKKPDSVLSHDDRLSLLAASQGSIQLLKMIVDRLDAEDTSPPDISDDVTSSNVADPVGTLRYLVEKSTDPPEQAKNSAWLSTAISKAQTKALKFLLENGPEPTQHEKALAFVQTARLGDVTTLRRYLAALKININAREIRYNSCFTALHEATIRFHLPVVKLLLDGTGESKLDPWDVKNALVLLEQTMDEVYQSATSIKRLLRGHAWRSLMAEHGVLYILRSEYFDRLYVRLLWELQQRRGEAEEIAVLLVRYLHGESDT